MHQTINVKIRMSTLLVIRDIVPSDGVRLFLLPNPDPINVEVEKYAEANDVAAIHAMVNLERLDPFEVSPGCHAGLRIGRIFYF